MARFYPNRSLPELKKTAILDFLIHLQEDRKLQPSTVNQALNAIRTLYRDHLGHNWDIWKKIKIKRVEALPHVITREEVALLLRTFRDERYLAYFTVVYQCGMRLSEALALKPKHIDGKRLIIRIVDGKGGKQREVPITAELHRYLQHFWKTHRNQEWLFPGATRGWKSPGILLHEVLRESDHPMTKASIWQALKVAKAECGLHRHHEKLSVHTLRHSYATHMLEAGASVRQVAAYLGHSSLKQIMVYLHLTEVSETKGREALLSLASPPAIKP